MFMHFFMKRQPSVAVPSLGDLRCVSLSATARWLHFSGFDRNITPVTHSMSPFSTDAIEKFRDVCFDVCIDNNKTFKTN